MKHAFSRQYVRRARSNGLPNTFGDFVCMVCHNFVCAATAVSGVNNRNHCPYCLSSRHVDLSEAGDRLSACKASMRPVALTFKKTTKKYSNTRQGELMLVHVCDECDKPSINRIAADDDLTAILEVLRKSGGLGKNAKLALAQSGIVILDARDLAAVRERLYGHN